MGIYRVKDTWYIDYYCDGRRRRKGVGSRRDAENALAAVKADILRGEYRFKSERKIHFEVFAEEYLKYAKVNKRSWLRDEFSLKRLKPHFKGKLLSKITPKDIEDYKRERLKEVKPSTINRELALLGLMFSLAMKWKYVNENPVREVKSFQEQKIEMKILDKEEAKRLTESAADRLKPIIVVALNTGMRRGEILNLRWNDIDFADYYIFIKQSKSGYARKVPMNSVVAETLKSCRRESDLIFCDPKTGGLLRIDKRFKTACNKAGIPDLRFHDLRHTAATHMVMSGIDLVTVKEILGHSKIETTMRYAHPTPENKRKAVAALESVFGKKAATIRSYKDEGEDLTPSIKSN